MQTEKAKQLLFGGVAPLFQSQQQLADLVVQHPGGEYEGKPTKSIAAYLSQVLNRDRSWPPHLGQIVMDVVTQRVSQQTWEESDEERYLVSIRRALGLAGPSGKLSPAHLKAVANATSPSTELLEALTGIEVGCGFPLSEETCTLLIRDYDSFFGVGG